MHRKLSLLLSLLAFAAMLLPTLNAAELSDDEWAQIKKDYLAKPRRVWIDNDGCDAVNFKKGTMPTVKAFYAHFLNNMLGREFDVLVYCPGCVGFSVLNRTAFGDRQLGCLPPENNTQNITQWLDDVCDTDPVELALRFARKHGYEFVLNMRANDVHDTWYDCWMPQYKKDHPELLCGSKENRPQIGNWSAYDFAHPEVRERFSAYIREWFDNYDPDGFMIDYYRSPLFFKSVATGGLPTQQEMDDYTEMLRGLRNYAEEVGRRRGRPIYFAFRLPDSLMLCKLMGMDAERWMKEGLMDIYIASGDTGRYGDYEPIAEACRQYGVQFYGSVDSSWVKSTKAAFNRNTVPSFNAQFAIANALGADGLYMFNMFYCESYFPHVRRSIDGLKYANKSYFVSPHAPGNLNASQPPYGTNGLRAPLCPTSHARIIDGTSRTFRIDFADDLQAFEDDDPYKPSKVQLLLNTNLADGTAAQVELNGKELTWIDTTNGIATFNIPWDAPRVGSNELTIHGTTASTTNQQILSGKVMLTGDHQPPWRRLWPGNGATKDAERIVDDALRLKNDGHGAVNFLYPLAGNNGNPVAFALQARIDDDCQKDAAVLRVGDGHTVETAIFTPGRITLAYSGKSCDFDTTHFHTYTVILQNGVYTLSADGNELFKEKLGRNAAEPATRLTGWTFDLDEMNESSLLIGGLSATATGNSYWKDIHFASIVGSLTVTDAVINVTFPPKRPESLDALLAKESIDWDYTADYSDGTFATDAGIEIDGYKLAADDDGNGILLDNSRGYDHIRYNNLPFMAKRSRYMAVEWEVAQVEAPAKEDHQVFQAVLRPFALNGPNTHYEFMVRTVEGKVVTAFGTYDVPAGAQKLRAVIDCSNGAAAVLLDGKLLCWGTIYTQNYTPGLIVGDCSSTISGKAALKYIKIAKFD